MKKDHGRMKYGFRKRSLSFFFTFIFLLSIALFVAGCSSQRAVDQAQIAMPESDMASGDGDAWVEEEMAEDVATTNQASESTIVERKLIKNGYLEIRSDDVEISYQNILDLVEKYHGFNTNLNRSETDAMLNIYAEFGIPAEDLDQFIEDVSQSERVDAVNIQAEDITDAYYDAKIRLETSEKALEKYYEFLADSKKVEDMVHIQAEIDRLTQEIELLKGSIKRWDSQVDYSYISIEILQKEANISGRREVEFSAMSWDDFKYWLNSGWNSLFSTIVSIFQWLAIIILVAAPIIIPLVLIIILIIFLFKRRKKKHLKKQQEEGIIADNKEFDTDELNN